MAYNNISSILRVSGMSSGFDTDSIVASLMRIERLKINKLEEQKTLIQWRQDSLLEVNNILRGFRDKYISSLNPKIHMASASTFKVFDVNFSEPSSAVSITANANAMTGNYKIHSISQLAKSTEVSSADKISNGSGIDTSMQLKDLELSNPLFFEDGVLTFEINGVEFTFRQTDTLQFFINYINASAANVRVTYSSLSDQLSISSKDTGSHTEVNIVNIKGNAFSLENSAFGIAEGTYSNGTDAKLNINSYDVVRSSNTFTIDGITYNLKDTTDTTIRFNISQNIDAAVDKIKEFVADYNALIDTLNGKISEKKYYDYRPLTSEQKEEMSEKEIDLWTEKAKSGILRNDRNIINLLNRLRAMIYDKVEGVGKSLSDIGLKTGAYYENGKITIDEKVLREALEKNSDVVVNIFTSISNSTDRTEKYKNSGFAHRISSLFSEYIGLVNSTKADDKIKSFEDRISKMEADLFIKENRYWIKFSQMEQALYKMQSQSMWISNQMFV